MTRIASLCALCVVALSTASLRAQGSNTAAAEVLFQEGRRLFKAGNTAEACPKLAESQRLDPATGTLLALALCHEQEKKFASAWAAFTDVETQSRRAGRKDRETLARDHAAALRPRLSTLTLEVAPEVAQISGLELRVDGSVNGAGSWGVAVPVDGGEHVVEASAPGRVAWSRRLNVKVESDTVRVTISNLEKAATDSGATASATTTESGTTGAQSSPPPGAVEPSTPSAAKPGSKLRLVGAIGAGVGLAVAGAGGVLGLLAKSKYDDAKEQCNGSKCQPGPYDDVQAARSQGTVATVLVISGGVVAAGGAALWLFAPRTREQAASALSPRIERIGLGPGSVVLGGRF